ncbi:MAG: inorganic diphosphatase [Marinagarivorans sp.]|nr:inorganic diphosphatase [Marinagarivorans sp.]
MASHRRRTSARKRGLRTSPSKCSRMSESSSADPPQVAVPVTKTTKLYENIKSYKEFLGEISSSKLLTFFEHYKDLEEGKWVKVEGWGDVDVFNKQILSVQ